MKASLQPVVVFALSAVAFIGLRSRDSFFVDGSLRCLSVYRSPSLQFHANNHMLYPVNVLEKLPILLVGAPCGALVCGYELLRSRKELSYGQRIGALASFVGLLFALVWDLHYGKLWLHPLLRPSFLAALALDRFIKSGEWFRRLPSRREFSLCSA